MKSQLLSKPSAWITTALVVTAALATGAMTTYLVLRFQSVAQSPSPNLSISQPSTRKVAALGYLEPRGEVTKLSAPAFIEGARVDQLLVKQGDQVKAGQVIAILDSRERLSAALQEAQFQVGVAQARLAQVKAGAKKGDINAQAEKFQGARAELEGQIATQKATIAGLEAKLQGKKTAQEATIERLKAELQNAQTDCGRYRTLYQEGVVADQERDRICLQETTARKSVQEAQANFTRIVTTMTEEINEAKANLARIITTQQRQIQENRETLDAVAEVRPVDVQVAQAQVLEAQGAVKSAQADLNLAYVQAPKDGQILKIHTWPGELIADKGIVEMGQTAQMYVTAEIYETEITQVRLGQRATIKSNGIVEDLQGIVDEIGLQIGTKDVLGTDPVADADARVIDVKIRLLPKDSQRVTNLTNLQVNVVIDTSRTDNKS